MQRWAIFALLVAAAITVGVRQLPFTPASYSPPERTNWAPVGPRVLPYVGSPGDPAGGDVLGNPVPYFRTLHSDSVDLHLKLIQGLHLILTHPERQIMA